MKTVIEMAREAGLFTHKEVQPELERFAELVRADALIRPCCGDFDKCQQVCMPRAAAQEREACAKVCEEVGEESDSFTRDILRSTAATIRARSNT
jgi:hypothetical protein